MTAPTGGNGGAANGASGSPNATVRGVHAPRPIGSISPTRPAVRKPVAAPKKPAKKGRK